MNLVLMAVNAKSDKAAFAAFREGRKENNDKIGASLKDNQLQVMLDALKIKHPVIADYLGSDIGIELMNQDSKITEHVIRVFTDEKIPILTVHDSYIVHFSYWQLLEDTLNEAYEELTGMEGINSKRIGVARGDEQSWLSQRLTEEAMTRSKGYIQRMLEWMTHSQE